MTKNHVTSAGDVYRSGLKQRIAHHLETDSLPLEVQAFLNSVASENAARRLLVIDDEHSLFDPNGTWIPKTVLLVRQLLGSNLVRIVDDKLVCSPQLEKLIAVRSMLESVTQQLNNDDGTVATLLELSCQNSDFREGSAMMSLCITPQSH
ncbi:MAG: hypothetical protein KDB01_20170 [Planctomycetaceae bacterium]|nr:hypothetical protein [Planctomycetaceae bacterium]